MEGMSMSLKRRRRRNTPEANSARLMKVTRVRMTAVLIILLEKSAGSSRPVPWVAPVVGKAQLPHRW
jgi:hypothetical protein